jgi:hypothetical protein
MLMQETDTSAGRCLNHDRVHHEENTFATSHQLVNVYGRAEKRYEIRSEDNAVDIQIHAEG